MFSCMFSLKATHNKVLHNVNILVFSYNIVTHAGSNLNAWKQFVTVKIVAL